jgi:two-component system cell cycle sensor histidine kinase/response regulator CckA
MATPLHVLILEDQEDDASLILRELHSAGFDAKWKRVQTESDFIANLSPTLDIILADFSLPDFDALRALDLLRQRDVDTPVIIISGNIGEDLAVHALQQGAHDYLLKDRLGRLGPAIRQALESKKMHGERRHADEQLRIQSQALAAAANGILITDKQGNIVWANPAFTELTGYELHEIRGKNPRFLKSKQHQPAFYEELWRAILSGKVWKGEIVNRRKDGTLYMAEQTITPVRDATGDVLRFVAIQQDIGERKRTEESLRETNEQLQSLVRAAPLGIIILSLEARVLQWNPAAERIFGWSEAEVVGHPLPTVPADERKAFDKTLESDWKGHPQSNFKARRLRKDGTLVDVSLWTAPLRDRQGRIVASLRLLADMSEHIRLEEQFRQAQKMEAVGRLAGGVAHDFNNILTVIEGFCDVALEGVRQGDPVVSDLAEIKKASDRAASLTRQLLALSRRQILSPKVLDLNSLIREMEKMLRRILGEDVDLRIALQEHLSPIEADPGQLEQILLNLAVNARDAMPGGGQLIIETKDATLDPAYAQLHLDAIPGDYVMLAVSDSGIGMDEATKSHLFEPFFTTKAEGKGTGLGLATVYGIVKQSRGTIAVYSEPGRGTCCKIYFPRYESSGVAKKPEPARPAVVGGSETILLAEDEETLRGLAERVLVKSGYRVLSAGDGAEAMKLVEIHDGPIHLLLTDVVMPKAGGRQVAEMAARKFPEIKVLYISGYTDDAVVLNGVIDAEVAFLQKPFSPDALVRKVRGVLDETSKEREAAGD